MYGLDQLDDYDSDCDSDYVPPESEESESEDDTMDASDTTTTYNQMLRQAKLDNVPSFTYTPTTGRHKNQPQLYVRCRQVSKSGSIYYIYKRCVSK